MNRREFIAAAAFALPVLAVSDAVAAESAPAAAPASSGASGNLDAIVAAASHCLTTGLACQRHCLESLGKGDTTLKDCDDTVHNMLASCEAMVKVGSYRSADEGNIKALARACAMFCRSCEATCRKHAGHHKVCADCMESCIACAKACEAYA